MPCLKDTFDCIQQSKINFKTISLYPLEIKIYADSPVRSNSSDKIQHTTHPPYPFLDLSAPCTHPPFLPALLLLHVSSFHYFGTGVLLPWVLFYVTSFFSLDNLLQTECEEWRLHLLVLLSSKGDRKSGSGLLIYAFLLSSLPFCEVSENNEVMKYLGSRM